MVLACFEASLQHSMPRMSQIGRPGPCYAYPWAATFQFAPTPPHISHALEALLMRCKPKLNIYQGTLDKPNIFFTTCTKLGSKLTQSSVGTDHEVHLS